MGFRIFCRAVLCLLFTITLSDISVFAQSEDEIKSRIDSLNQFNFQFITTNPARADSLFTENISLAESIGYRKGMADSYYRLALASNYLGKYEEDVNYSIKAIELYEELDMRYEAGNAYAELGYRARRRSFERAELYMQKGISILSSFEDSIYLANAFNNYGIVKLDQNQADSALIYIQNSLEIKELNNDRLGIAYSYAYLGNVHIKLEEFNQAIRYIRSGYEIREELKDSSGMAIDLYNIGNSYFQLNNFPEAAANLNSSLELALAIDYPRLAEENYSTLSRLHEKQGNYGLALTHQKEFTKLRENRINESTNNRLAELEVQFETEQKEKELALKNAALAEEKLKVRQQRWVLSALGGFFVTGLFISGMIYRQQTIKQNNLRRENELRIQLADAELKNRIHQERERISRDLHDNVGSQITNLITGLEIGNLHIQNNQNEQAINILGTLDVDAKRAMTDLRETIWLLESDKISFDKFLAHIKSYVQKQKTYLTDADIKVTATGNPKITLQPSQSLNLLRIIQEAVNNAHKHSGANRIRVAIAEQEQNLIISISDNGSGFNSEVSSSGNGLNNMRHRAEQLAGKLEINSPAEMGTEIRITIPIYPEQGI